MLFRHIARDLASRYREVTGELWRARANSREDRSNSRELNRAEKPFATRKKKRLEGFKRAHCYNAYDNIRTLRAIVLE